MNDERYFVRRDVYYLQYQELQTGMKLKVISSDPKTKTSVVIFDDYPNIMFRVFTQDVVEF